MTPLQHFRTQDSVLVEFGFWLASEGERAGRKVQSMFFPLPVVQRLRSPVDYGPLIDQLLPIYGY